MTGISTGGLCDRANVTPRQVHYWVRRGLLVPSIVAGTGPGKYHRWSDDDVRVARVLGLLAADSCDTRGWIEARSADMVAVYARNHSDGWVLVADRVVAWCQNAEDVPASIEEMAADGRRVVTVIALGGES